MHELVERVARRAAVEGLTKSWLMAVRRGWLHLMRPEIRTYPDVFRALAKLDEFVDNLRDQVMYVRRGPLSGNRLTEEHEEVLVAFKRLEDAISDARSRAQTWAGVYGGDPQLVRNYGAEAGTRMLTLYQTNFDDATSIDVRTRPNPKKNQWAKTRQASMTELLDKILDLLYADARRIVEHNKQHPDDPHVAEPSFKEFHLGDMMVVVVDPKMTGGMIPLYVRMAQAAQHLLERKGLGEVWRGALLLKSDSAHKLPDWEKDLYAKAGYKDLETYSGLYDSGPDVVEVFGPPSDRTVKTVLHELGHRYWYKHLTREKRLKFADWLESGMFKAVTKYGETNASEAFAEVFSFYALNKDMGRDQIESFRAIMAFTRIARHPKPCRRGHRPLS